MVQMLRLSAPKKKVPEIRVKNRQFLCKLDISGINMRCLQFKHNNDRLASLLLISVARLLGSAPMASGTAF